jgi:pyruvate/2-oxoglutarate dehydrogenase complex dihydrolipoamide dehydrogenase (E3) component
MNGIPREANPLDSRRLNSFVTLFRTGTFTAATRQHCLTQSAPGESIRALESEIGCLLLISMGKTVIPSSLWLRSANDYLSEREIVAISPQLYKRSGAELVMGTGRFVGPKTIEAELNDGSARTIRGTNVTINTATRATLEPIPGLAEVQPLTHIEALELDHIPKHLVVLGAGYVGLELAQAFRRFGAEVTLLDRNSRLVHNEDEDISQGLEEMCRDEGIHVVTNAKVSQVNGKSGEWVRLFGTRGEAELNLEGTHLLVAGGRTPNTSDIGLEKAGVETTERGHWTLFDTTYRTGSSRIEDGVLTSEER